MSSELLRVGGPMAERGVTGKRGGRKMSGPETVEREDKAE